MQVVARLIIGPFWILAVEALPTPSSIEDLLLGYGVLGVMFVLVMVGWLHPKYVNEEAKRREAIFTAVIERQATAIERLADRMDDLVKAVLERKAR